MTGHGVYYEFIPMQEFGQPNAQAIPLQEVQLGVNYALVITTLSGLYRYVIGDTIQFISLLPYTIKVTGRTKHFINAFGEELIVDNADEAIARAANATNASVIDYTAAPLYFEQGSKASHEWIVEFETAPNDTQNFIAALDYELQQLNSDYEAKRYKDLALTKPTVHIAPKGLFNNWLALQNKLGGQHKVPRLSNDRTILNTIKQLGNL
jgi:hypothetical protein